MMRKFKHKTLGWIATGSNDGYYQVEKLISTGMLFVSMTPRELIEGCSDREEVVEKDWIDELYDSYQYKFGMPTDKDLFREYVEKYAPKQVKFFEQDVTNYLRELNYHSRDVIFQTILGFLKQHNLLAEESIVGEGSIPCQHENTGEVYTSNPPQYKCKKCGDFYRN